MSTRVTDSPSRTFQRLEQQVVNAGQAAAAGNKDAVRALGQELWNARLDLQDVDLGKDLPRLARLLPAGLSQELVSAFQEARTAAPAKPAVDAGRTGSVGSVHPALAGLEPKSMWRFFSDVAQIPHGTGNEAGMREYIKAFAAARKMECEVNDVGDVLVRVNPQAKGNTVALQAHMDMVCVSKDGAPFDFKTQPVQLQRDGDTISAKGTSLGADNGIGVAFALALADEAKGPLELLFTVDEEDGFTGVEGVAPGWLKAKTLINIDSEEEGYFTIASAGARDFHLQVPGERADSAVPVTPFSLTLEGLKGGHSGIEIHKGRTNALKALGQVLEAAKACGGVVYGMAGGTAPNVIPSSAKASIGLPPGKVEEFKQRLAALQTSLATVEDPVVSLSLAASTETRKPLTSAASDRLVQMLAQVPSGVITASPRDPSVPFVSNNLGILKEQADGGFEFTLMSRSPASAELSKLEKRYATLAQQHGATMDMGKEVPGWAPNYKSPMLTTFLEQYKARTGKEGKVLEIHAGLECGALKNKYPGMDLISVGPDISGVHSPNEKVSAGSAGRTYELLQGVLKELQNPTAKPAA